MSNFIVEQCVSLVRSRNKSDDLYIREMHLYKYLFFKKQNCRFKQRAVPKFSNIRGNISELFNKIHKQDMVLVKSAQIEYIPSHFLLFFPVTSMPSFLKCP